MDLPPPSTGRTDDLFATLRAAIAELASHDPEARRFGARHHQYRPGRPISESRLAAIEVEANVRLPDDYRAHLLALGDGGAGPYYGLLPLDHPNQRALLAGTFPFSAGAAAAPDADPFQGVVGVGHLGCGYVALLVVTGPARGQVWLDARGGGAGVIPIYPSFSIYVADWITRRAHAQWLAAHVPPGVCALPAALSSYFHQLETQRGLAPGELAGDELRAAIAAIDAGGIATTQDEATPFFGAGDALDLCVACEQIVDNLDLNRGCFVPGVPPIPARDRVE
jgi:hypothetical protein